MNTTPTALKNHLLKRKKVDKETGCWIWQGWINREGYGRVQYQNKKYLAHRLSAVVFKGYNLEDYDKGLQVNHLCHNRACINPEHFYIGTQEDNMDDLTDKLQGTSLLRRMILAVYEDADGDHQPVKLAYEIYSSGQDVPRLEFPEDAVVIGVFDIEIPPVKE